MVASPGLRGFTWEENDIIISRYSWADRSNRARWLEPIVSYNHPFYPFSANHCGWRQLGEVSGLVGLPRLDLSEFAKYWSSDHDHWSPIMMMMMMLWLLYVTFHHALYVFVTLPWSHLVLPKGNTYKSIRLFRHWLFFSARGWVERRPWGLGAPSWNEVSHCLFDCYKKWRLSQECQ